MARIRERRDEAKQERAAPRFAPAGQSTQMIVGADASADGTVLRTAQALYAGYRLSRIYYSAFSPIPGAAATLPAAAPPLWREHRLYQADWLIRRYGFRAEEIVPCAATGALDLDIDPKLAWALAHRDRFPVDVNCADRETLLRVPGLGVRNVKRIVDARRHRRLRYADLVTLRCDVKKARDFVITADHRPRLDPQSSADLRARLSRAPRQQSLF